MLSSTYIIKKNKNKKVKMNQVGVTMDTQVF